MKTRIAELRRKQNGLHKEASELHERAVKEGRSLIADEQKLFDERMGQVGQMQGEIEREERLAMFGGGDDAGASGAGRIVPPDPSLGMGERDLKDYSLMRAIRAQTTGDWRQAGLEREASDAVAKRSGRQPQGFFVPYDWMSSRHSLGHAQREQRAIGIGAGSGAPLIATDLGSFIDILKAKLVLRAAGAVFLTGLEGNLDLPRRTASATMSWVANGVPPAAEATQVFGILPLRPKTGSAYVDITRTMLQQASMDVELLVRDDLNDAVQLGIDRAGLHGAGASNEPLGLALTAGIGSVAGGANGAVPTYENIVALETAVAINNADVGRLAYITNTRVRGKLKTTVKSSNTAAKYIWNEEAPSTPLNGTTTHITNQVRSDMTKGTSAGVCSGIFYGNWGDLVVALWGGMDITADIPDNRTGTARVAALVDVDVTIRNVGSFAAMQDALTT